MNLNEYQTQAFTTAKYPRGQAFEYLSVALVGEIGEFFNEHKKAIRSGSPRPEQMKDELGDCFWYMAAFGVEDNFTLEQFMERYTDKTYLPLELDIYMNHAISRAADLHWQMTRFGAKGYPSAFVYPIFSALMGIVTYLGFDLGEILQKNLEKLQERSSTGTIKEHS